MCPQPQHCCVQCHVRLHFLQHGVLVPLPLLKQRQCRSCVPCRQQCLLVQQLLVLLQAGLSSWLLSTGGLRRLPAQACMPRRCKFGRKGVLGYSKTHWHSSFGPRQVPAHQNTDGLQEAARQLQTFRPQLHNNSTLMVRQQLRYRRIKSTCQQCTRGMHVRLCARPQTTWRPTAI